MGSFGQCEDHHPDFTAVRMNPEPSEIIVGSFGASWCSPGQISGQSVPSTGETSDTGFSDLNSAVQEPSDCMRVLVLMVTSLKAVHFV